MKTRLAHPVSQAKAALLKSMLKADGLLSGRRPEHTSPFQGIVVGPVPVTPHTGALGGPLFTVIDLPPGLDIDRLRGALGYLFDHHDVLRMRILREGWKYNEVIEPPSSDLPLEDVDLTMVPDDDQEQQKAVTKVMWRLWEECCKPGEYLLRLGLARRCPPRPDCFIMAISHSICDAYSLRVLGEDLETVLGYLARGIRVQLPPKTTSYVQWAERMAEYILSEEAKNEEHYWKTRPWDRLRWVPTDRDGITEWSTLREERFNLDPEETQALIRDVPRHFGVDLNDVLITALVRTMGHWTGNRTQVIDTIGHGRNPILSMDLTRTVGWFGVGIPVVLDVDPFGERGEILRHVSTQIRQVPMGGQCFQWFPSCFGHKAEVCFHFDALTLTDRLPAFALPPKNVATAVPSGDEETEELPKEESPSSAEREDAVLAYRFDGLAPGANHRVRLHFVEPHFLIPELRVLDVWINDDLVLRDFDVPMQAGGALRAIVKEFETASDSEGVICLRLVSRRLLCISAIEVLPLHSQEEGRHWRVNCGGEAIGNFVAERDFEVNRDHSLNVVETRRAVIDANGVADPAPNEVYQTCRCVSAWWFMFYRHVVNTSVERGHFSLAWQYNNRIYRRATIRRLAENYMDELRQFIQQIRE